MTTRAEDDTGFELINAGAEGPVIVSVPHAGRHYPRDLIGDLRVPPERLLLLEDRHVDLIARSIGGVTTLIATRPRLWIDLNRSERELDPDMVHPRPAGHENATPKMRGGLGLVPRRLNGVGEIWRDRLPLSAVMRRVTEHHRPYHAALERLLARAKAHHGVAVLVDLHSMPPLGAGAWPTPPRLIIGDRFGRSAAARFVDRALAEAERSGFATAENRPYAGGYIIDRHGRPGAGVHAIQLEIDRSLYLGPGLLDTDPDGLARMRTLLSRMIAALTDEAIGTASLAAE